MRKIDNYKMLIRKLRKQQEHIVTEPILTVEELEEIRTPVDGHVRGFVEKDKDGNVQFVADDHIVCPYCGHIHEELWEMAPKQQDYTAEVECDVCERTFGLSWYPTYTFTATRKQGNQ